MQFTWSGLSHHSWCCLVAQPPALFLRVQGNKTTRSAWGQMCPQRKGFCQPPTHKVTWYFDHRGPRAEGGFYYSLGWLWRIKTRRERSPMFPWTGMHCFLLFLISVYVHSYNSYLLCTSPHPTTKTPWSKKQTWKMMLGEGNTQTYPDESTQAVSSKQMVSVSNSNKECKYAMFGSLLTKLIIVFMSMGR